MARSPFHVLTLILFVGVPAARAASDADIFALINFLRPIAAQVQINGSQADWNGIPILTDPNGDAGADSSRDIVGAAIAPREDDLLVLIVTAANPAQEDFAFSLDIDFMSRWRPDVRIDLSRQASHRLTVFPEGQSETIGTLTGLEVAFGSVVEIRIPYAELARRLPSEMVAALTGKAIRSFIRVRPHSRNSGGDVVDYGPEVASYRLIQTPYALDPPLPQPGTPRLSIEFPFERQWFIHQGAFANGGSHSTRWAYDLSIRDSIGFRSDPPESPANEDYYNWDEPAFSPVAARVIESFNQSPDGSPLDNPPAPPPPDNRVLLDLGNNVGLSLRHFRQGSVAVNAGDTVASGDFLGSVGDSGDSGAPHMHMMFVELPHDTATLPLALTKVRVSINSTANDPWARDLAVWEPRESFFVKALSNYVGPLAVAAFSLPEGEIEVPYSASLQILGGTPPYTAAVVKGSLPPGLVIDNGSVTGTPTSKARRNRFTIEVRDQSNALVTKELSLATFKALTISTARLKAGKLGRSYTSRLKGKGGKGPYVWSMTSGTLPSGMSWNSDTATLTGTPSATGTFDLVFRATDVLGGASEKALVLTIRQ